MECQSSYKSEISPIKAKINSNKFLFVDFFRTSGLDLILRMIFFSYVMLFKNMQKPTFSILLYRNLNYKKTTQLLKTFLLNGSNFDQNSISCYIDLHISTRILKM